MSINLCFLGQFSNVKQIIQAVGNLGLLEIDLVLTEELICHGISISVTVKVSD